MKKLTTLLVAMFGILTLGFAYSGKVSGTLTGAPAGVTVWVTMHENYSPSSTWVWHDTVQTDTNGYYESNYSFTTSSTSGLVTVVFNDCTPTTRMDSTYWSGSGAGVNPVLNFVYCPGSTTCNASYVPGVSGMAAAFTNTSTPLSSSGVTYSWSFGDGTFSNAIHPTHTYSSPGYYAVCLYLYDTATTCNDVFCDTVYINSIPGGCSADFSSADSGLIVFFSNLSTPTGASTYWSFGDGTTSSSTNPVHTYSTAGTYTVCLAIVDSACVDSICKTVTVTGTPCVADFSYVTSGLTVNFTDLSTAGGSTTWTFGDGTGSGASHPTHTYAAPGTYTVCLIVNDTVMPCNDTVCKTIVVGSTPPCAANFTSADSGLTVFFTNNSTSTGGTYYSWTFGDGNSSIAANPVHTYGTSGTYTVCLTIWDSLCSDTICKTVVVTGSGPACSADFSWVSSGLTVNFTNLSTTTSSSQWLFGDGNSSTATNPVHTYGTPGSYPVYLVVWNSTSSCLDTITKMVVVSNSTGGCTADFTYADSGLTVFFTNMSTSAGATSYWSFGDGTGASSTHAVHSYGSPGTYTVCLIIVDSACVDSVCKSVTVTGPSSSVILSGNVTTSNTAPGASVVYLITADSNQFLTLVDSQLINSGTAYSFIVSSGVYYVKAALLPGNPDHNNYLPTYFNNSLSWTTATAITVGSISSTGNNINLIQGINPGGPGFIGGLVSAGANKTAGPGDPVAGALVLLTDINGGGVASTLTDANGEYSFGNLAYGTYRLFVDILNKTPDERIVVLDADNEKEENANFVVRETEITTGLPVIANAALKGLYPNPASEMVRININTKAPMQAQLVVNDLVGQQVMVRSVSLAKGNQSIELNIQDLPQGIYLLNLVSDHETSTLKLIKN